MTSVTIQGPPPPATARPHQQQRTIFGGSRRRKQQQQQRPPFAMHNAPYPPLVDRKAKVAEMEVKKSTQELLTDGACLFTKDETHAKKFKSEITKSVAVDTLVGDQLHFISELPGLAQLTIVLAEKWMSTQLR